jgi:bifunctional non-homologous end joining protein LigD
VEARGEFFYVVGSPILQQEVPKNKNANGGSQEPPVGYVNPMLASAMTGEKSLDDFGDDWVMEEKYDGVRVVVSVEDGGKVKAWSRPKEGKVGLTRTLPSHIVHALGILPPGTYDGELIAGTDQKSYDVSRLDKEHTLRLVLFDILRCIGRPTLGLTYRERHELLDKIFDRVTSDHLWLARSAPISDEALQAIWQRGGEGVILKRLASTYRAGWRSPDWVKIKKVSAATCVITGYEEGLNGPYSKVALRSDEGVECTAKTKNNKLLADMKRNPKKFIGKRLVIQHYGKTPAGKYRGPIIWDHLAGEGE